MALSTKTLKWHVMSFIFLIAAHAVCRLLVPDFGHMTYITFVLMRLITNAMGT